VPKDLNWLLLNWAVVAAMSWALLVDYQCVAGALYQSLQLVLQPIYWKKRV
jgi:hypothetical protein